MARRITSTSSKARVIKGFGWRLAERSGAQGVNFIVSLVLARILLPTDYGTVALITVFTTILQVFVDSGLGTALIQKRDADEIDFSTVFYTNVLLCTLLYLLLFATAPFIADFYSDPRMAVYIRVLGLVIVISGVRNIQQAYVSRKMIFRKFFFATFGGTLGSAVVGIVMAMRGFGVWALIAQQLFNEAVGTLILWLIIDWRPIRAFSFPRLKTLFSFGWKLLASALIDTTYNNVRQLIIGKMYAPASLAFYNQGKKFPELIVTNINASIDSVLLPAMASEQENVSRVRSMTRRSIKTSIYIMAPLMIGLAACADHIVFLVLTDRWLPAVPFLRIFCVTYLFWPLYTANLNAIKSLGRSDIFLRLEIEKKTVGIILLLLTMNISVMAMAYSLLASTFFSIIINSSPNKKLLKYSYKEQLLDICPTLLISCIMGAAVYALNLFHFSHVVMLMIQIIFGAVVYFVLSKVFRNDSFMYIGNTIKKIKDWKKVNV